MDLSELLRTALDFERTWVSTLSDVRTTPWGAIHRTPRYPLVFMGNLAWIRRLPDGGAEEVLAALDEGLEGTDVRFRHIVFEDAQEAFNQQASLSALGFRPEASLAMARLGMPVCITNPDVELREVGRGASEEDRRRITSVIHAEAGIASNESRQVQALEQERAEAVGMRDYVAYLAGVPAGTVSLWCRDKFALIENVGTLPEHRMKGVGRTMLFLAGKLAWDDRREWTLLFTDLRTGPTVLYQTLGFQPVGEIRGFLKLPDGWAQPS